MNLGQSNPSCLQTEQGLWVMCWLEAFLGTAIMKVSEFSILGEGRRVVSTTATWDLRRAHFGLFWGPADRVPGRLP